MTWKCPGCDTQIRYEGDGPDGNRLYRCHVCHLELTLDLITNRMTVPSRSDAEEDRPTHSRRVS